MRTSEWPYQVLFTLLTYGLFAYFPSFRFIFIFILPLAFGYFIARDEWRMGRAMILAALPLLMGVVLLFVVAFFGVALNPSALSLSRSLVAPAAAGFLILLVLSALVGFPLAWAGTRIGRPAPRPSPLLPTPQ